MTSLASSRLLVEGLQVPSLAPFRRALRRVARALSADTARRPLAGMPPHLRRDIGLGDIDLLDL